MTVSAEAWIPNPPRAFQHLILVLLNLPCLNSVNHYSRTLLQWKLLLHNQQRSDLFETFFDWHLSSSLKNHNPKSLFLISSIGGKSTNLCYWSEHSSKRGMTSSRSGTTWCSLCWEQWRIFWGSLSVILQKMSDSLCKNFWIALVKIWSIMLEICTPDFCTRNVCDSRNSTFWTKTSLSFVASVMKVKYRIWSTVWTPP